MKLAVKFYDNFNLGDDLFLYLVEKRYQDVDIYTATSKVPNDITGSIFHPSVIIDLAHRVISKITSNSNYRLRRIVKKSDILLIIGGSIFIEQENIAHWHQERNFYKELEKPYYILGSNIGPYASGEFLEIVRNIMRGASDVCLRDKASYAKVSDIDSTRISTDIAFTLDESTYTDEETVSAVVSIINSYSKFDEDVAKKYDDAIREITLKLLDEGYKVTYMSFCSEEGDELAINRILSSIRHEKKNSIATHLYSGNLRESLQIIASSKVVVGSRFHASILGLIFNKKVLPIAYSDKTLDILKDMDFSGQVIDIRKIDEFDINSVDFNAIPIVNISAQKKLAETQFQELDKVLAKKP